MKLVKGEEGQGVSTLRGVCISQHVKLVGH